MPALARKESFIIQGFKKTIKSPLFFRAAQFHTNHSSIIPQQLNSILIEAPFSKDSIQKYVNEKLEVSFCE